MGLDKQTSAKLTRFATAFRDARERNANEADTVMLLIRFFDEVLGYDPLKGDVTKELAIKDRYCDVALKVDGVVRLIIEAKSASQKSLVEKHIEQAENYASRAGLPWVLLTNGIEWRLYHLTFNEGEGIAHDLAFVVNLVDEMENLEPVWSRLELLSRANVKRGGLEDFWAQKKVLSPASVVRVLFHEEVLLHVRRMLRKEAGAMLDVQDVFSAIRDVISNEALAEAGDLGITKRRKHRRRVARAEAAAVAVATTKTAIKQPAGSEAADTVATVTVTPPMPITQPVGKA